MFCEQCGRVVVVRDDFDYTDGKVMCEGCEALDVAEEWTKRISRRASQRAGGGISRGVGTVYAVPREEQHEH